MAWLALFSSVVAVAFLGLGAWRFARSLFDESSPLVAHCAALGLASGLFVTAVAVVGRAFGSFDVGLLAAAICGLVLFAASFRASAPRADIRRLDAPTRWWLLAALVLVAVCYTAVAVQYQMHDELVMFGHKAMVEQLRLNFYPIHFPPIPTQEARYHYGFDILAGVLARGFGLGSDPAIDIVTVLLALFMSIAAAALVCEIGLSRAAPFAAVAVHFGSGLAWLLLAGVEGRHPRCLAQYHHPSCGVELFPTSFINVFQHPVSFGVPLLLSLVLVLSVAVESRRRTPQLLAFGLFIFSGLAIAHIVYFALGGLAALSALVVWMLLRWRFYTTRELVMRVALLLAVLGAGLALAWLEGGMFAPAPVIDPHLIVRRPVWGFPENLTPGARLEHHIINLGLPFVLLPIMAAMTIIKARFGALMLLAFSIGGVLVPHLYVYTRTWDIVKFPSAAMFALAVCYVVSIDSAWASARFPLSWLRRAGRALLIGGGVVAFAFVVRPLRPENRLYDPSSWKAQPTVKAVIDWFVDRGYEPTGLIYTQSKNVADQLSVYGGLSVVGSDYDFRGVGIKDSILTENRRHLAEVRATMSPTALEALGVRWVVVNDQERMGLGPMARNRLLEGRSFGFSEVAHFDAPNESTRRIYRFSSKPMRSAEPPKAKPSDSEPQNRD